MYFPNRLELLFLSVFAFPNASRSGFDSKITYISLLEEKKERVGRKEGETRGRRGKESEWKWYIFNLVHCGTTSTDSSKVLHDSF